MISGCPVKLGCSSLTKKVSDLSASSRILLTHRRMSIQFKQARKGNDSSLVGNRRTIDLPKLKEQPEAAQLLHSLLAYAGSAAFQPAQAVGFMLLKRLLGIDVVCN